MKANYTNYRNKVENLDCFFVLCMSTDVNICLYAHIPMNTHATLR